MYDCHLIDAFLAWDGIPVNPELPEGWDDTSHEDRPNCHFKLWGRAYITTQKFFPAIDSDTWFDHWPNGTRYDVRCLDGGAWDRSTNRGSFACLSEAIDRAESININREYEQGARAVYSYLVGWFNAYDCTQETMRGLDEALKNALGNRTVKQSEGDKEIADKSKLLKQDIRSSREESQEHSQGITDTAQRIAELELELKHHKVELKRAQDRLDWYKTHTPEAFASVQAEAEETA